MVRKGCVFIPPPSPQDVQTFDVSIVCKTARAPIKYIKLFINAKGTSNAKEAKVHFSDMERHKMKFNYKGTMDNNVIALAHIHIQVGKRFFHSIHD